MREKKVSKKSVDKEKIYKVLLIVTIAAIWGQSMIRREASQAESDALLMVLNPFEDIEIGNINSDEYWMLSGLLRKFAHIVEYGILGCELMLYGTIKTGIPVIGREFRSLLVIGLMIGLIDETIQIFSHRGSLVSDVWIDAIGVFLGLYVCRIVLKYIASKNEKTNIGR